ncbi:hypothetical protein AO240_11225 [Pseudomonas sp. ICMP 460]|nr:hypothetical protein AO240_11225 [Pseudomonas sp. ICMP 460]
MESPTFDRIQRGRLGRLSGRLPLIVILIWKRPVKPRWPNADITERVNRQDAGLAATGQGRPVAAARFVISEGGHTEPKRGAEWWGKSVLVTFALFKSDPL